MSDEHAMEIQRVQPTINLLLGPYDNSYTRWLLPHIVSKTLKSTLHIFVFETSSEECNAKIVVMNVNYVFSHHHWPCGAQFGELPAPPSQCIKVWSLLLLLKVFFWLEKTGKLSDNSFVLNESCCSSSCCFKNFLLAAVQCEFTVYLLFFSLGTPQDRGGSAPSFGLIPAGLRWVNKWKTTALWLKSFVIEVKYCVFLCWLYWPKANLQCGNYLRKWLLCVMCVWLSTLWDSLLICVFRVSYWCMTLLTGGRLMALTGGSEKLTRWVIMSLWMIGLDDGLPA